VLLGRASSKKKSPTKSPSTKSTTTKPATPQPATAESATTEPPTTKPDLATKKPTTSQAAHRVLIEDHAPTNLEEYVRLKGCHAECDKVSKQHRFPPYLICSSPRAQSPPRFSPLPPFVFTLEGVCATEAVPFGVRQGEKRFPTSPRPCVRFLFSIPSAMLPPPPLGLTFEGVCEVEGVPCGMRTGGICCRLRCVRPAYASRLCPRAPPVAPSPTLSSAFVTIPTLSSATLGS
jgi:hypothetical protein